MEDNAAGIVREWWYHVATAYWFIVERNTVTDEIVRTYSASEIYRPPDSGGTGGGGRF
jgi:sarcosine oxidase subunit delta